MVSFATVQFWNFLSIFCEKVKRYTTQFYGVVE
jgi:hypothetical protein